MRKYDQNQPLVAIHMPKTGGVSCRKLFKNWYADGLINHYGNATTPPEKHNLTRLHTPESPIVVYGHFNRLRGFGIEQYYPEAEQFVTILRDPFERAVSRYFYVKNTDEQSEQDLRQTLLNQKDEWGMLCHFPCEVTLDNYQNLIEHQFIEVGVMEHLDESLKRIADSLNKNYEPESIGKHNVSQKNTSVPYDLRDEYIEKHSLEYAVYNYAFDRYR